MSHALFFLGRANYPQMLSWCRIIALARHLDLESSNLEFQWIYYYVARWEKWSQGSTSPTQAGRFSTKTQALFVYFDHTICLAYFDYNEFSFSQLAGRSSTTRSKPPSSIRRLHTGGELQARKSKCSKLINISFF